jgi:hypothetical protein
MKALSRYGKLLEDGTRKAADTTGNIWHHRTYCTHTRFLPASFRRAGRLTLFSPCCGGR